jgi:putative redox protein
MKTNKTDKPLLKTMQIELRRLDGDFHFVGMGADNTAVHTDAATSVGGTGKGVRPMELILMGLGSCSAIDIVLILKKARQVVEE